MNEPGELQELSLEEQADEILRADARKLDPETGKPRGIKGDNPILFAEHIAYRWKHEIINENGFAEPNLTVNSNGQPGMYFRREPRGGRKVNSEEQRKRGAGYFK